MSFHTSTNSPNSLLAASRRKVASLPLPSPTSPTKICQCEQPVRGPHQSVSGAESRGGRKGCQKCWGRVASRKHAPLSPVAQRTLRDSSEDEDNDDETTVGSSLEEECSERSLPLKKRARTETVAPVAVATTDTSSPSSPRSQRELLSESLLLTTTTTTSETVPIYNPTATDQTAALISKAIKSINSTENPVSVQHGMTVLEALEHSLRGLSKEDAAEARWQFHYMELTEYRKKNGHCLVPRPHSTLGAWVNTQRVLYAKRQRGEPSSLTPLRIRQLEALDFVWDDYGKRWNDLYQELVAYKKKTGSWYVCGNFEIRRVSSDVLDTCTCSHAHSSGCCRLCSRQYGTPFLPGKSQAWPLGLHTTYPIYAVRPESGSRGKAGRPWLCLEDLCPVQLARLLPAARGLQTGVRTLSSAAAVR
jgi:hypothetical protein